jgi:hypothetical protein
MSHWAELDKNNKVIRVVVADNNDPNGDEGYQWLLDNFGGNWIKTSFNAKIRKNFAGKNMTYDERLDAFIPEKCHSVAVLDENICQWNCADPFHKRFMP